MIFAWLATKTFGGLARWSWLLILAGLFALLFYSIDRAIDGWKEEQQDLGAAKEHAEELEEIFERVEKADEIYETFSADERAVYDECLRSARTPANCERFLPR